MSNPPNRCSKRGLDKETDHTDLSRIERTTIETQLLLTKLLKEKLSAMNCLANINNLKMSNPPNGPSKHRLDEETYHTDLSPKQLAKLLQEKRSAMICIAKLQTVLAEMDLLLAENITMMEFDVIQTSLQYKRFKKDKPEEKSKSSLHRGRTSKSSSSRREGENPSAGTQDHTIALDEVTSTQNDKQLQPLSAKAKTNCTSRPKPKDKKEKTKNVSQKTTGTKERNNEIKNTKENTKPIVPAQKVSTTHTPVVNESHNQQVHLTGAVLPKWHRDLQEHTPQKLTENQLNITKRFIYYDDEETLLVPEIKPSNDKCLNPTRLEARNTFTDGGNTPDSHKDAVNLFRVFQTIMTPQKYKKTTSKSSPDCELLMDCIPSRMELLFGEESSDEIIQTTTEENKTSTTKKEERNKSKESCNKSYKRKREDKKHAKN